MHECVFMCSFNLDGKSYCVIMQDSMGDWFVKELSSLDGSFAVLYLLDDTQETGELLLLCSVSGESRYVCVCVKGVFANEFGQVNH